MGCGSTTSASTRCDLQESVDFYVDLLGRRADRDAELRHPRPVARARPHAAAPVRARPPRRPATTTSAITVDDVEPVYRAAERRDAFDREAFGNHLVELPGDVVQLYVRDPAGNLVEIDHHGADRLPDDLRAQAQAAVGLQPAGRREHERPAVRARVMRLADLTPAETPAGRAALEVVEAFSSPALVNHCIRSYLWAAGYARATGSPTTRSCCTWPRSCTTSGSCRRSTTTRSRSRRRVATSPGSSARARAGRSSGASGRTRSSCATCGTRSTATPTPRVTCSSSPPASTSPAATRAPGPRSCGARCSSATRGWGSPQEFTACFEDQARRKPKCAAAAAVASGIGDRMASNPLE